MNFNVFADKICKRFYTATKLKVSLVSQYVYFKNLFNLKTHHDNFNKQFFSSQKMEYF